jgi:excisionase family DNA binding protein
MEQNVKPLEVILVNAKQAGQILGVSERTVYNLMYAGALSSVKIGNRRRFHSDELKRLAATGVEVVTAAAKVSVAQRDVEAAAQAAQTVQV